MEKVRICTTHGKVFRRCGIEFGPDPIEITIGEKRDLAKRIITAEDLAWIEQAAGPATREEIGPDGNTNVVPTGAVLRVEPVHGGLKPLRHGSDTERADRLERKAAERDERADRKAERELTSANENESDQGDRDDGGKGKPAKK